MCIIRSPSSSTASAILKRRPLITGNAVDVSFKFNYLITGHQNQRILDYTLTLAPKTTEFKRPNRRTESFYYLRVYRIHLPIFVKCQLTERVLILISILLPPQRN